MNSTVKSGLLCAVNREIELFIAGNIAVNNSTVKLHGASGIRDVNNILSAC